MDTKAEDVRDDRSTEPDVYLDEVSPEVLKGLPEIARYARAGGKKQLKQWIMHREFPVCQMDRSWYSCRAWIDRWWLEQSTGIEDE